MPTGSGGGGGSSVHEHDAEPQILSKGRATARSSLQPVNLVLTPAGDRVGLKNMAGFICVILNVLEGNQLYFGARAEIMIHTQM